MTREEAASILEKDVNCFYTDPSDCYFKGYCANCENNVTDHDLHEAMRVVIDILKNGEEDGQKGETSTTKDQAAEQLHSPGETVEGSHPGDGS